MDWNAFHLSLKLAVWTLVLLLPVGVVTGRWLARTQTRARPWLQALFALPLVLPPTVVGYYLLVLTGAQSPIGELITSWFGVSLVFSFPGLVLASVLVNLPFAILPVQRAFEVVSQELHDAAACCGMNPWQAFTRIEMPLAWPGILSAAVLTLGHTLGEFGVVLMVGGNIPGETRTLSIAIFDRVQAFDPGAAGRMAGLLLLISLVTVALGYGVLEGRSRRARGSG
ncbi:MAG TPA: molybdate ABC transporter permease subunit [Gammaproteobacteria bacterium]|jgi:molybdate transport system permease protein|nr:molybdate ABC transporter permease subunit [Acidiferrobacteraceae bacterium]MDP6398784.1 molybdate ABC transporter permease subunit [Arenicellales bacterium]MDP6551174.1 molybdate ABC transporter permease subunit [Arenicellales bacterium]MDP6918974.1 molybdate ABC transporter permease subunit [Arenicellales bacterium]HCX88487.1 molybdate ABC transporter permease subunit [Gammaproteobacteria bacterium]|tara:strand:- start:108 stop:785 length:678 start_codon:yes stop_codon:yes gene_type:complete